jgi:hypothetical protein
MNESGGEYDPPPGYEIEMKEGGGEVYPPPGVEIEVEESGGGVYPLFATKSERRSLLLVSRLRLGVEGSSPSREGDKPVEKRQAKESTRRGITPRLVLGFW